MNNLKKITLNNGTILQIRGDMVICCDCSGNQKDLTRGQQKLLSKLAADLNCAVPMSHLYTAYSGETVLVDEKGIKENVAKMKVTLPEFIKESVKSVRGVGYKLVGEVSGDHGSDFATEQSEEHLDTANRHHRKEDQLTDLIGEYYGYYLDPLGTGTVLGAYIRIENVGTKREPRLEASSVLGIRSEQVLLCDELSAVFSQKGSGRREAYKEFKKTLSNNDQRCSWWQGNVIADGTQAIIDLQTRETGARWQIILELKEYMGCRRNHEMENDKYRGGLGVVVATRTKYGTVCLRFGLVRKAFVKKGMNDEDMKLRLKLMDDAKEAMWKPLKLSNWLDKYWYEWIMTE